MALLRHVPRVLSLLVLVDLALPSQLALAQTPDTLSPAQRAGLALARLGAGQTVRIHRSGFGRLQGQLVSSSPSLVTLRTDGSVTDISAPSVDSVWVKHGSHAGTGALIGAVPGVLVLGATFVYSRTAPAGETRDLNSFGGTITGLFLLGVGTAIGAIIGSHTPKWQLQAP